MSGILYVIGAVGVVLGVVTVGFGVPISEFSFGNTLIIAGTTLAVGGLIVAALGVVSAQLQRLSDALGGRAPPRAARPGDVAEPSMAPPRQAAAPGPMAFPPKTMPAMPLHQSQPVLDEANLVAPSHDDDHPFAPTLRNPDEPPVTVEDDVSLSPGYPMAAPASQSDPILPPFPGSAPEPRKEPTLDADWRSPPASPAPTRQTAYFDAMWPAEPKPAKAPADDKFEPKSETTRGLRETTPPSAMRDDPEPRLENDARSVAILKSGVVDGMGYTLYVDGSIEAQLPQGTLRFASINELRSHLENNA